MALVVFLRGCNVGGQRRLRPTVLAQQLARHGVVNIGAAGTLVVLRRVPRATILAELRRRLPFDADIMICDARELVRAVSAAPHAGDGSRPDVVRFVSIFARRPRRTPAMPLDIPAKGKWLVRILALDNRFLFGLYRRNMKTIGYLDSLDKLFGVRATTRNWNTITAVMKVLGAKD